MSLSCCKRTTPHCVSSTLLCNFVDFMLVPAAAAEDAVTAAPHREKWFEVRAVAVILPVRVCFCVMCGDPVTQLLFCLVSLRPCCNQQAMLECASHTYFVEQSQCDALVKKLKLVLFWRAAGEVYDELGQVVDPKYHIVGPMFSSLPCLQSHTLVFRVSVLWNC